MPGTGSWEGERVLGGGGASREGKGRPRKGGLALIPQVLLGLGGDQREGLWKRKGFSGQACPETFTRAALHLCSHTACPLNQNIPNDSRFLSPNLPEPVGAPVQEERCLTGCWVFTSVPWHPQPPEWGGGLHHTRAIRPWSDPSRSPCRHSPSRAWGLPQHCLTSARKAEGKTLIQTVSLPTSHCDPGVGENPESAAGSCEPCSVLCDRGMAVEQSWGWTYASAAPRSAGRRPGPAPSQPPARPAPQPLPTRSHHAQAWVRGRVKGRCQREKAARSARGGNTGQGAWSGGRPPADAGSVQLGVGRLVGQVSLFPEQGPPQASCDPRPLCRRQGHPAASLVLPSLIQDRTLPTSQLIFTR